MKGDHPFYEYAAELSKDIFGNSVVMRAYSIDSSTRAGSIYTDVFDRKGPQIAFRTLVGLIVAPVVALLEDEVADADIDIDYLIDTDAEFGVTPDGNQRISRQAVVAIIADDGSDHFVIYKAMFTEANLLGLEFEEDFEKTCLKMYEACIEELTNTFGDNIFEDSEEETSTEDESSEEEESTEEEEDEESSNEEESNIRELFNFPWHQE